MPSARDRPLLEVEGLSRVVGGSNVVWNGLSFSLADSELLILRGPSGAGKTLLLRVLAALDTPEVSSVLVCFAVLRQKDIA